MNLGRDVEQRALQYLFEKLLDPDGTGGEGATNKAQFLIERIANLARFASRDDDMATIMDGRGFINSISLVGDKKLLIVKVATLAGRDPKDPNSNRYQFIDCKVFKPHLIKWFTAQANDGTNKLEGLLVKVRIRNPYSSLEQGYLNNTGILDSIEIC